MPRCDRGVTMGLTGGLVVLRRTDEKTYSLGAGFLRTLREWISKWFRLPDKTETILPL
jgi:hypothetical protein